MVTIQERNQEIKKKIGVYPLGRKGFKDFKVNKKESDKKRIKFGTSIDEDLLHRLQILAAQEKTKVNVLIEEGIRKLFKSRRRKELYEQTIKQDQKD